MAGRPRATLNRELAALKRAFKLAVEQERIADAPVIKLLAEHNRRQGFVEPGPFEVIASHLPDPVDDIARFAYTTGWRKEEVLEGHQVGEPSVEPAGRRLWSGRTWTSPRGASVSDARTPRLRSRGSSS